MDDVARAAGVSRAAVSLALRGSSKVSPARRAEIEKVAQELGYRPNANASQLARASRSTIGVMISDLHNPVNAEIFDGFTPEVFAASEETYLASGFNSAERERLAIESFLSHRVSGVVLIGSRLPQAEIEELADSLPTVVVGRPMGNVNSVSVDDAAGGRLATAHLIGLGHTRIAHISGGTGAGGQRRQQAFLAAMNEADLDAGATVEEGDYTQSTGLAVAKRILSSPDRPTAIFAANDLTALGVMGAASDLGLRIPEDLSVVGFDDIPIAATDFVSLTTVSYGRAEMGAMARQLIQGLLGAEEERGVPQDIHIEPHLVGRSTTIQRGLEPV